MTQVSARFATNQDLDPQLLREAFGVFPSGAWPRARSRP